MPSDYCGLEFSRLTIRKAAKEHKCGVCEQKIKIHESHYEYVGKHENQFFSVRECIGCKNQ